MKSLGNGDPRLTPSPDWPLEIKPVNGDLILKQLRQHRAWKPLRPFPGRYPTRILARTVSGKIFQGPPCATLLAQCQSYASAYLIDQFVEWVEIDNNGPLLMFYKTVLQVHPQRAEYWPLWEISGNLFGLLRAGAKAVPEPQPNGWVCYKRKK